MLTNEKQEVLKYYNLGLSAYKQQKWEEAQKAFEMALKIDPSDGLRRCIWIVARNSKRIPA